MSYQKQQAFCTILVGKIGACCKIITAIALHHPVTQQSHFWSNDFVKFFPILCHLKTISIRVNQLIFVWIAERGKKLLLNCIIASLASSRIKKLPTAVYTVEYKTFCKKIIYMRIFHIFCVCMLTAFYCLIT